MSYINISYYLLFICVFIFLNKIHGQVGYEADSLQIKVYTEIQYLNSQPQEISIKKVFCDYCSKNQIINLGNEAIYRSFAERFDKKNIIQNGKKKLAIYIRISKKDFAAMKEEEEETETNN